MDSRHFKVLFLFLLSMGLLFFGSKFLVTLGAKEITFSADIWKLDYMLWFVPIAAFFFIYMLMPYLRSEFGFGGTFIYIFPALFALFSYFAYQLSAWWYYSNQLFLATGGKYPGCAVFLCIDVSPYGLDFWKLFVGSHFLYFVLAGILGWASRQLIEHFDTAEQTAKTAQ